MTPAAILGLVTTIAPLLQTLLPGLLSALPGLPNIFGGATPTASGQMVTLLQEALNAMQAAGTVQFDGQAGQPNSPLVADGNFGGRTFAAIKAVQSKFGYTIQEPLASMEMNIIAAVLSKL